MKVGIVNTVLTKKRGHTLSIVVENEDGEWDETEGMGVMEPVPGQREGLVDPLELDGEHTSIVELPISITPRARSREGSDNS